MLQQPAKLWDPVYVTELGPAQVTGAVGWRKDNLKYKKNEVFLDIVEQVLPQAGCLHPQRLALLAEPGRLGLCVAEGVWLPGCR